MQESNAGLCLSVDLCAALLSLFDLVCVLKSSTHAAVRAR